MPEIDRVLPEWDVKEVHEIVLETPPDRALEAALASPAAPDLVVRGLLRLRGIQPRDSIEELLRAIGFEELERRADEVVFGASGRPWRPGGGLRAFADATPGTVRMAANFRVESAGVGRARLSTETRVFAADAEARRSFRRYWRVVGPFSALVRRRWLSGVRHTLGS
ncbi:MAG: hypothetical protein ACRDQT_01010 [Gaiellaceae bacterium]